MKLEIQDTQHKAGELAYYDSLIGLIPCKVLSVYRIEKWYSFYGPQSKAIQAKIRITANRGTYKKGEILEEIKAYKIIPRNKIKIYSGQLHIQNSYHWIPDYE